MKLAVGDIVHYYMRGSECVGAVEAIHPKGKRVRVREVGSSVTMEWTRNRRGVWRDALRTMELYMGPGPESMRKFRKHCQKTLAGV